MYEFPSHHSFKHFSLNGSLRTSGYTVEDDFLVAFDDCYKLFFQRLQGWTNLTQQHILKSFSQNRCHYIHSQSDLLNTCSDYSLEACSCDETLQGTIIVWLFQPATGTKMSFLWEITKVANHELKCNQSENYLTVDTTG